MDAIENTGNNRKSMDLRKKTRRLVLVEFEVSVRIPGGETAETVGILRGTGRDQCPWP